MLFIYFVKGLEPLDITTIQFIVDLYIQVKFKLKWYINYQNSHFYVRCKCFNCSLQSQLTISLETYKGVEHVQHK